MNYDKFYILCGLFLNNGSEEYDTDKNECSENAEICQRSLLWQKIRATLPV